MRKLADYLRILSFELGLPNCRICGKKPERKDLYMLEDLIWEKINDDVKGDKHKCGTMCWDCMTQRVKDKLKRNLKETDFKKNSSNGNPEFEKLFGKRARYSINAFLSPDMDDKNLHLICEVMDNTTLDTIEEKHFKEPVAQREELERFRDNWLKRMKTKYPDSTMPSTRDIEETEKMTFRPFDKRVLKCS